MGDFFKLVATVCIVQMAVIMPMVERVRAYKNESRHILWSRRAGFAIGVATLLYSGLTLNLEFSRILMLLACVGIFTVNIISLRAQNANPLHGHRFLRRASVAAFFRRYP